MRRGWKCAAAVAGAAVLVAAGAPALAQTAEPARTTAWRNGALRVDTAGVVSRSDFVLAKPSWESYQSMPLGNGRLGAALWAQDGFKAQLNRADTFPNLKSAGQLTVPGLLPLMRAPDYRGRLRLYDGELAQQGGGMSARSYVRADRDQFVLEVTGADPDKAQTADLRLWQGRTPAAYARQGVAALAETFKDAASGSLTGAVAAMTADGRGVTAKVVDGLTVRLTFRPNKDGSFRIVTGVPAYTGGDVGKAAGAALAGASDGAQRTEAYWHRFWQGAAPMRISSPDGTGEYMEQLRAQQLYMTAATMRSAVPSSHGGVINMFSPWQDAVHWSADYWWHFNLRQPVYTNLGADTEEYNTPYFRLYLDRLKQMRDWTKGHWAGAEGACVAEYLRYDGTAEACDSERPPDWLNRIVSTGPEVVHNLWLQYRYTRDESVLDEAYPLMRDVARFYLSILREGGDGKLHLEHVNALETQWDTSDPTPDLAAMRVIFPIIAAQADRRGDAALARDLRAALPRLPDFRTVTRNGEQVIAWSGTDEASHNTQNPDTEPLFPWGLYGADSPLMQATFRNRVFVQTREWSEDALLAARLGLAGEMRSLLVQGTKDFQIFPSGFGSHGKNDDPAKSTNYYNGWNAVVGSSLQEALVQSYQGVVRVAPAWPKDWDVAGSVQVEGGHRVSTEVRGGEPNVVGIQAAGDDTLRIANPWPGQKVRVVDGATGRGRPLAGPTAAGVIRLAVKGGHSYLLERVGEPYASFRFQGVGGQPATEVRRLGDRTLGVG
ncbi:glycoside hydrolase [Actinomadura sp. LD22]|uniref:Glycoside hydrolase n=1 Tax=Actinomadura physcomitrii TaxID=2650748 RepID=A0A6I4MIR7_9ACTN|nr:glycoside hydrolase [Actinomadura physcomitrii]MWA03571.1 glycoside hydrolase [Actinomadura physcomitrii]